MQRTSLAPLLSATRRRDSCWITSSPGPFEHFDEVPALALRQRARLPDADPIADAGVVQLVVGEELLGPLHGLRIAGVAHPVDDADDDGLLHARGGDEAL